MQQTQRTVTKIVPNIIVMQETKKIRIAAYCRVSTDSSDQEHSFDAQVKYYTEMIEKLDDAVLVLAEPAFLVPPKPLEHPITAVCRRDNEVVCGTTAGDGGVCDA